MPPPVLAIPGTAHIGVIRFGGHITPLFYQIGGQTSMGRANGTGSIVDLGKNRRKRYAVKVSYLARPGLWKQKYLAFCRRGHEQQETLEE